MALGDDYPSVVLTVTDYGQITTTYEWDFGDETTETTTTNTVLHAYAEPGTYEVSVVITTQVGEQGSAIDCEVVVPGCLSYPVAAWEWEGEDGADSAENYAMTLDDESFGPGKIGTAISFGANGVGQATGSSTEGSPFTRQPGASFTMAMWLFVPSNAYDDAGGGVAEINGQTPINKGEEIFNDTDYEYALMFYQPAGGTTADVRLYWLLSDGADVGTGVGVIDLGRPTEGQWHFVVVGYDDSVPQPFGKINDGTLDTYTPFGGNAALWKGYSLKIGSSGASGGEHHFAGAIDNTAFWKCVLTEGEMTTLWNGGAGLPYPFE